MQFHEDDRAQRLLDIFSLKRGQINVSYVQPGHIVAWHRHKIQIDEWCCLKGSFKVGLSDGKSVWWKYLSDKNFHVLNIQPNVWHGYMALEPNSILLYYLTEKYNQNDEFKVLPGYFNEDWEIQNI